MLVLALAWICQSDVETVSDVEYATVDGVSLKLDLYLPAGGGKRAAVICIHGGGWKNGDKKQIRLARDLAQKGIVAVSINYRLSGQAKYPAAVEDCRAAVRWVRDHAEKYGIDPSRLGVFGSSAGGHLALMVAVLDDDPKARVQAVVSWFGPADFTEGPAKDTAFVQFLGASFAEKPELYKEASPIAHVTKDDPPALLIHGDADDLVPIRHSEAMRKALAAAGVEAELVTVKGAGHGFSGRNISPGMPEIVSRSVAFFEKRLR